MAHRKGPGTARLSAAWRWLAKRASATSVGVANEARFRLLYERFREILTANDATLQLIADIEDRLAGRAPFSMHVVRQRVRQGAMDVFVMVKNLNLISNNRHTELYEVLSRIDAEIERELTQVEAVASGPLVIPLALLRGDDAPRAGSKMANLGEIASETGVIVPDGFVITTAACGLFMEANALWERARRLESLVETREPIALTEACSEVREAIFAAPVPAALETAILAGFDELSTSSSRGPAAGAGQSAPTSAATPFLIAMRSSAVGEDTLASHAGQYHTELNVTRDRILETYREILASAYTPAAVSYRYERGMTAAEELMAVGCVRMLEPRCSGVLYSRPPEAPEADAVVISTVPGLAAGLAAGRQGAQVLVVSEESHNLAVEGLLTASSAGSLVALARHLEAHFGSPQEVEWAIEPDGTLAVLQSRPMVTAPGPDTRSRLRATDQQPILAGGLCACPGAASGTVALVWSDEDLDSFPEGSVLVARHSSPTFSRVMKRCRAIVTDIGSPTGHMASLAREFGVPAVVGAARATHLLQPGELVTVDATACRIYAGALPLDPGASAVEPSVSMTPAQATLRRIARLVTPLALRDPASPDFRPATCQSLHDITRFVHETAFGVMFHFGDLASTDRHHSHQLVARLPIDVRVFDVGGALAQAKAEEERVRPEEIMSVPLRAFLAGLMDERIRWDQPRPVSARGFLSVIGASMAGPPAEALKVGRASYAIVSDKYMNFSTKAGYHFSTVDTYCGESLNKNYIHFRFAGGAADAARRERRVRLLSLVLGELDFTVQWRSDLLVARLEKYDQDAIAARLADLGRLTLCMRQLDMLMDSDASPDHFARAFLDGELARF